MVAWILSVVWEEKRRRERGYPSRVLAAGRHCGCPTDYCTTAPDALGVADNVPSAI
ncbi:MAG: hypothetical protein K6E93_00990 [Bacteroidales bacterium]|nr:hypothetical protein [Bacteroidales bacterium]